MKKVIVTVSKDGKIKIRVEGVEGGKCRKLVEDLEGHLGKVRERKEEANTLVKIGG